MAKDTLTVTDNRTGKQYEIPIEEGGVIRAAKLRDIKTGAEDFGLMSTTRPSPTPPRARAR